MFSIDKSDFIEFTLQPFIQRLDESVASLSYKYDDGTTEEYCVICYQNNFSRKVNITGNSEKAIVSDVLKML